MAVKHKIEPEIGIESLISLEAEQETRYRFLFQNAPISFWEEDMSAIKSYFDELVLTGITNLPKYFDERPAEAVKCIMMTRILDVNKATLKMYKAKSKPKFISELKRVFTPESSHIFKDEIIALAEGKTSFSAEAETVDMDGERIKILYQYNILPGHENDFSRVLISIIDLTPLIQAEQKVKESQEIHQLIYDQAYIGIARITRTGRFIMVNKRFCEIMGYEPDELKNKVFFELVHPDRKAQSLANWDTLLGGKSENFSTEEVYRHKDGTHINVNISVSLIRNASGKPDSYMAVYEDITERKKNEDALRKFSHAVDNSLDGMVMTDKKGVITYSNPAADKMYGYQEGELIGLKVSTLSLPDDLRVLEILPALKEVGSWKGEVWQKKKDGTPFQIELSSSWMHDSEGEIIGTIGVARDITEKKKTEEEIVRNHNLLKAVFEGTSDSIYVKDSDGNYLMINSSGAKYFKRPVTEVVGKDDIALFDLPFADKIRAIDKNIIDTGRSVTYETKRTYMGENLAFSTTKSPFYDHKNNIAGLVGISRNVTEQKKAEQLLKDSEEFFRSITENAPIYILKLDRQGRIQYINKTGSNIKQEDVVGLSTFDFFSEKEHPVVQEKINRVFDEKTIEFHEVDSEAYGSKAVFQAKLAPIVSDNEVVSVIALVEDITEKKLAEEQLNKSESRWRSIFEHADDIIITVSRDTKIVAVNHKLGDMEPMEAIGKSYLDIIPKSQRNEVKQGVEGVFKGGMPYHFETKYVTDKGKEYYFSAIVAPVATGEKIELVTGIIRDITHLKKTEGAIINAMIEGQDNERKRIARELHDGLGQNLSAVKMSLTSLEAQIKRGGFDVRSDLMFRMRDVINEAIQEVRNISHDLMPDLLEQFGIVSALDELSAKSSGETIKISFEPVDMKGRLKTNVETGLYRMAQELINNAVRHSMAKKVHIQLIHHGNSVVLSVEDDGIGFNLDLKTKGIGLKNVESRTKLLNGSLEVESKNGEGTLVTVEIPI